MNTPPQGSSFGGPEGPPPFGPPPGGAPPQGPTPGPYRGTAGLEPNRGTLVLTLGILSIIAPLVSAFCCMPVGIIGLALGVPAILMGRTDMKKYAAGTMDPTGYSSTQAGWICGLIGSVLAGLELLVAIFLVVIYGGFAAFALLGAATNGGGY